MSLLLTRAFLVLSGLADAQGSSAVDLASTAQEVERAPALQGAPNTAPEQRRVDLLYEGALVGARDAQDFAETPGYRRLLESVANYSDEELHARVQRPLDIRAALAAPDEWRGEIVRVFGQVGGIKAERLSTPLRGSVDVYRAYLVWGNEGVVVDCLRPPPELRLQADVVAVEGVFFRTVRFENKEGAFKEAPYLIARELTLKEGEKPPPRSVTDSLVGWIVVFAGCLFLLVRIGLVVRSTIQKKRDLADSRASRTLREHAMAPLRASLAKKKQTPTLDPKA